MYQRVKARISKTNKFREVMLRRPPDANEETGLYTKPPAYIHVNSLTVSGKAYETQMDRWVFCPEGVNKEEVYIY